MKYRILSAIRCIGILKFADTVKYGINRIILYPSNRRFRQKNPSVSVPPHDLAFDAFNTFDWNKYHAIGLEHARIFANIVRKYYKESNLNILEWGCGPGRLIGHMPELFAEDYTAKVTGCDYNTRTISWCKDNIRDVSFCTNELLPPTQFDDEQFDVTYNFSVLTHLSDNAQKMWIKEFLRVLKPGGILICTTHGNNYTHLLTASSERNKFDSGEVVIQGNYTEGKKWFFSIHPEKYVRESLLSEYEGVHKIEVCKDSGFLQDVWIARKPK